MKSSLTPIRMSLLACLALLAACAETAGNGAGGGSSPNDVQATAPGRATCVTTSTSQAQAGAAATNAVRARSGLPPVRANATLSRVAAEHACDMAKRGRMTHRGSTTAGPGQRVKAAGYTPMVTAENIAAGPFDQGRVLSEWHSSSGHLANLMIPQMRDYGIGQAVGADGKTRFWSAVYAAPR